MPSSIPTRTIADDSHTPHAMPEIQTAATKMQLQTTESQSHRVQNRSQSGFPRSHSFLLPSLLPSVTLCVCGWLPLQAQVPPPPAPFIQDLTGTTVSFEMKPIPGATVKVPDASAEGGSREVTLAPFYLSATEIPWQVYDVFVFRLDETADQPAGSGGGGGGSGGGDAVSRPSKPYIPPDRGYGHDGYATISVTNKSAKAFCEWLSLKTGKKYRLPTEAEWEHACRTGLGDEVGGAVGGSQPIPAAILDEQAWHKANADNAPHPIATKKPNALGLFDMLGNVAEWVQGTDATPVLKGGSFKDKPEDIAITNRATQTRAWNQTDPNMPKSQWWLSDAPFAGLRVVCEIDTSTPTSSPNK